VLIKAQGEHAGTHAEVKDAVVETGVERDLDALFGVDRAERVVDGEGKHGRRLRDDKDLHATSDRQVQSLALHWKESGAHLANLQLDIVDRARLDGLLCLLHDALDEHDRLVVDALDPADHLLGHEFGLDDDEALEGVGLLAENDKHHLGACERGRRLSLHGERGDGKKVRRTLRARGLQTSADEDGLSFSRLRDVLKLLALGACMLKARQRSEAVAGV
jgi:hypothetical protein